MSVRNRNVYANRRSTGNGSSAVRSVLVIFVLALLSFALGFFVLARLMPDNRLPSQNDPMAAVANNDDAQKEAVPSPAPISPQETPHPVVPTRKPKQPVVDDGPVIEADTPTKVPTSAPTDTPANKDGTDGTTPATPKKEADANPPEDGPVQTPKPVDPTPAEGETPPPNTHKRYGIQIGLYSTREAAEQQAQVFLDRSIKVKVRSIQSKGRTLYRIQYSRLFRDRDAANTAREELVQQGITTAFVAEF